MKKLAAVLVLAALMMPALASPGFAQDHDRDHGGRRGWHRDPHWGGDIHAFRGHDLDYWHGGHWFHGRYGGRLGWWWTLGGAYYYYPAPVYPYPDPYVPPLVTAPPTPGNYWYYCRHPRGYYPYVPVCRGPWYGVQAN